MHCGSVEAFAMRTMLMSDQATRGSLPACVVTRDLTCDLVSRMSCLCGLNRIRSHRYIRYATKDGLRLSML